MGARVAYRAGVGGRADDPRRARLLAAVWPYPGTRANRRAARLAGASLGILALTGAPPRAFAACLGENSASVTCDATNQATAGTLTTSFAGTTTVNVNAGGKIDTGGASATVTAAGSLTFNNNDTTFGITNVAGNGVTLANDFGSITYAGSGTVTATSTVPVAGLSATSNAAAGGIDLTTGGAISVTTAFGATGINAAINNAANASAISVQINNNINVTSFSKNSAVDVTTSGLGSITVTDNGVITTNFNAINAWISNPANASALIVHVNNDTSGGISAAHFGTGSILVDGSGNLTGAISANKAQGDITISGSGKTNGIFASQSGDGNILVDRSGANAGQLVAQSSGNGNVTVKVSNDVNVGGTNTAVFAAINSASSTGTLTVDVTQGDIAGGSASKSKTSSFGGGIVASTAGLGATNVTLASAPVVSGAIGILASATNASSTAAIIVSSDATVTGTSAGKGGSGFDEFGAAGLAVTGIGIGVSHSGTGNISVIAGVHSAITADQVGIQLLSGGAAMQSGGTINLTVAGTVSATGGIFGTGVVLYGGTANTLTNFGSISGGVGVQTFGGSVTLDNAGAITGTNGSAVVLGSLGGANDVFIMDGPNASLSGVAFGSGTDTFRFAGSGANIFDISQIGSGWTSLEKTGSSIWTLTGTSTYTGNTIINAGVLQFSTAAAMGGTGANITVANGGTAAAGYAIDQAFLARIDPGSGGVVALAANSGNSLDFNAAGLANVSLGAVGSATFSGTLTPFGTTYRLGGGGGTLTVSSVLGGVNSLIIDTNGTAGGTVILTGANSYSGGTIVNAGTLLLSGAGTLGAATGTTTVAGGTLDLGGTTQTQAAVNLAGGTLQNGNLNAPIISTGGTVNGIGGTASLTTISGITLLLGTNGYSGSTTISGGTLDFGGTTQTLAALNLAGGTLQNGNLNAPITSTGGVINGIGGAAKLTVTAGTTFVLGTNTFAGPTTVNGGMLDVIGSITDPTVNAGGLLTGTGTVGSTQVNTGGTLAPGNGTPGTSLMISGNLAFQPGAIYLVQLNSSTASLAGVTGAAALGGASVSANFAGGTYVSNTRS